MSHRKKVTGDPAKNVDLVIRKSRDAQIVFRFLDASSLPFPITDAFELNVKVHDKTSTNLLQLTTSEGLTVSGNEITATFTVSNTAIDHYSCFWELKNTTTKQNWLTGKFYVLTGEALEDTTTEVEASVNTGDQVVEVTITIPGEGLSDPVWGDIGGTLSDQEDLDEALDAKQPVEIQLATFATELTFDSYKDLTTVSGGTRTFTLAASGHKNGVGIVARINTPVAVNFPAGFEKLSGSDNIDATKMNIIVFRYFDNYDGAGSDKVLYTIKNQTAI